MLPRSHMTGNVCTFAQYGALKALDMTYHEQETWRVDMAHKRDCAYRWTAELFDCVKPQGAFYLFPDVTRHLKNGMNSAEFAGRLLKNTGVAVVPGEAFGMPGHIRISYAVSKDELSSGFDKIREAL